MNKMVGEEVGALLSDVVKVNCDLEGKAIGNYIRVRVLLDVRNPLIRWSNINIGGLARKILFRYEKLADFCFSCGRLDHLEKHYSFSQPDDLCYYGPWLCAVGQNPPSLEEAAGDLNRLNARKINIRTTYSPILRCPTALSYQSTQAPRLSNPKLLLVVSSPYLWLELTAPLQHPKVWLLK